MFVFVSLDITLYSKKYIKLCFLNAESISKYWYHETVN